MAFERNKLTEGAVKILKSMKNKDGTVLFNNNTLERIGENEDFALKLNEFAARYIGRENEAILLGNKSKYDYEKKVIHLMKTDFDTPLQVMAVTMLAHELTHALSTAYLLPIDTPILSEYIMACNKREGEALYSL